MEPIRPHRDPYHFSLKSGKGFTTKRVSQKRNSDFSFANERREEAWLTTTSETQYESWLSYLSSAGGAKARRAFTLIELMVVLTIIIIMTTIVLTSQSSFNKTLILANTAYDIALTLRSAQTYGVGSRTSGTTANVGYGVHFLKGNPGSFTFFADAAPAALCTRPDCKPGDYIYTGDADVLVQTYTLGNGMTIKDFCAFPVLGIWSCESYNGGLTSLDIVFARPNSVPFMSTNGSYVAPPSQVTAACIIVTSPQGGVRFVSVAASGQITANAASCP
jgi:prepilin-type N-terminal cleavage/methylation domain-containing protein